MKTLRTSLLTLALATGCGGPAALSEEDTLVGEASSALTVAEESGDVTGDAAAAESDSEASAAADDATELPEVPAEGDGVCDLSAKRQRVIAHYDTDGDAKLDRTERQALKADLEARVGHPVLVRLGLRARAFVALRLRWAFDDSGDGVLSQDERTALVDALEARCQVVRAKVMERFDVDHNGALDATERQAAKEAFVARVRAARQALLAKYDTNKNGVLDPAERLKLRADRLEAFRTLRATVIAHFDADHDGSLSDAEKLALKQALQTRIAQGRDAE